MCASRSSFSDTTAVRSRSRSRSSSSTNVAIRVSGSISVHGGADVEQVRPPRRRRREQRLHVRLVHPRQRVAAPVMSFAASPPGGRPDREYARRSLPPSGCARSRPAPISEQDAERCRSASSTPTARTATSRTRRRQPEADVNEDEQHRQRRAVDVQLQPALHGAERTGADRRRSGYSPALTNSSAAIVPNVRPQKRPGCHG